MRLIVAMVLFASLTAPAESSDYVFAWPFENSAELQPRGGTSRGPEVVLATEPSDAWRALREPNLTAFERDRRAILAMAGGYRTSFDFLETVVFSADPDPARPYRSWGTERVYVVDDRGETISLQHVIVMYVLVDGEVRGPHVQKHWRQDWRYEPRLVSEFRGRGRWERRNLSRSERRGAWAQEVYQVDDAPRYSSVGRWQHSASGSVWTGSSTWRPLPRREFSVRDDYDVLVGVNRHTILPSGWVHEQDNVKLVLDDSGVPDADGPYRAREVGVDRYERIRDFDFAPGDEYWERTRAFWRVVRGAWTETLGSHAQLRISDTCRGRPAFEIPFAFADRLQAGEAATEADYRRVAEEVLECTVLEG